MTDMPRIEEKCAAQPVCQQRRKNTARSSSKSQQSALSNRVGVHRAYGQFSIVMMSCLSRLAVVVFVLAAARSTILRAPGWYRCRSKFPNELSSQV